jgi:hypothetical protein
VKKIILIVLLLVFYSTAHAQFIKNIGVKIGGTVYSQKWEYSDENLSFDPDTKTGLNIGVFAEFLNLPFISIIGEVNYVEKGIQKEMPIITQPDPMGPNNTRLWKAGLNYINLSLLGKVRLDGLIFTPYVIAGPKLDIEIGKSDDAHNNMFFNDFPKSRFGFKAGVGTEIKLFKITFLAEVLYDADFGKLIDTDFAKITSSAIDFRTGISISL